MIKKIREYFKKYYQTKKPLSIVSDVVFISLIIALLIPGSRIVLTSFVLRIISPQPSAIIEEDQTIVSIQSWQWPVSDMQRGSMTLERFNDKPIFLNFWATWCPPCIAELPSIQNLYNDYSEDVNFLLVTNEELTTVKEFLERKEYNLPVYFNRYALPPEFQSSSIPTTFIIDKEGHIVVRETGAAKWDGKKVRKLLNTLIES